ncbi:hypothetical protein JTE90_000513 [Oedothorax gibbosus]|uniref:WW domain-containing protein n=1 Tax=Oedothorax gibbosus TaxID=931172 RepID=A0AAV6VUU7_9ARAC|nr:hypothetical protein JTE90_000513 [Oedothorax gibbosus]
MEPKKVEWFAIVEPCTKEEIYVNMFTGECVWHPPHGALVKKADDNLWWEIFDPNSSRFYYYNAANQKTVWQKPQNSDVLSLSKLQALKQSIYDCSNGDIKKESTATQTTTKISAKNIHKNVGLQKSASTQTASYSPVKEKFKQGFSSRSEHALSAYSYDSGCSGDSSIASQSHSSLDSTNYQCYRKLEFCSAESVDSSYFQDQNVVPPGRISWHETKQWAKRGPHLEFSSSQDSGHPMQRPVLGNIVPVWQQHSFECWQAHLLPIVPLSNTALTCHQCPEGNNNLLATQKAKVA